jgi:hypothetical protein
VLPRVNTRHGCEEAQSLLQPSYPVSTLGNIFAKSTPSDNLSSAEYETSILPFHLKDDDKIA